MSLLRTGIIGVLNELFSEIGSRLWSLSLSGGRKRSSAC